MRGKLGGISVIPTAPSIYARHIYSPGPSGGLEKAIAGVKILD
jgi:hypothetical protein